MPLQVKVEVRLNVCGVSGQEDRYLMIEQSSRNVTFPQCIRECLMMSPVDTLSRENALFPVAIDLSDLPARWEHSDDDSHTCQYVASLVAV